MKEIIIEANNENYNFLFNLSKFVANENDLLSSLGFKLEARDQDLVLTNSDDSEFDADIEEQVDFVMANVVEPIQNILRYDQEYAFRAVRGGDLNSLEACEISGFDINGTYQGATLLHLAAVYGHAEICEHLIDKGADVLAVDDKGISPLGAVINNHDLDDEYRDNTISSILNSQQMQDHYSKCRNYAGDKSDQELLSLFSGYLQDEERSLFDQREYRIAFDEADGEKSNFRLEVEKDGTYSKVDDSSEIRFVLSNLAREKVIFEAAENDDLELLKLCIDLGVPASTPGLLSVAKGGDVLEELTKDLKADYRVLEKKEIDEALSAFLAANQGENFLAANQGENFSSRYSGFYKVTKDAEGEFKVFKIGIDSELEMTDWQLSFAVRDIAESQIFEAVQDGNEKLFHACLKLGVSKDIKDHEGSTLTSYAKLAQSNDRRAVHGDKTEKENPGYKGILKVLDDHNNQSRDKFRLLASNVRKAYVENIGDRIRQSQAVEIQIKKFGVENPDFNLDGLTAGDMMAFMDDIRIVGMSKGFDSPQLDKPASDVVRNLLDGKNQNGESDSGNSGRNKDFYNGLFLACFEEDHRFVSEEHNHNIRNLLGEQAKAKTAKFAQKNLASTNKIYDDLENLDAEREELDEESENADELIEEDRRRFLNLMGSIPTSSLRSTRKGSVVELYQRARFEDLKTREGLRDSLTYEEFSGVLGQVIGVLEERDSRISDQRILEREEEIGELTNKLTTKRQVYEVITTGKSEGLSEDEIRSIKEANDNEILKKAKSIKRTELDSGRPNKLTQEEFDDAWSGLNDTETNRLKGVAKENLLKEYRVENEETSTQIKNRTKFLEEAKSDRQKRLESTGKLEVDYALNAMFGPDGDDHSMRDSAKKLVPNRYLGIALDLIREGGDITVSRISENISLDEDRAKLIFHKRAVGSLLSRRGAHDQLDLRRAQRDIAGFDKLLKELSIETPIDELNQTLERKDLVEGYPSHLQGLYGAEISRDESGLVIHDFNDGIKGFNQFSSQVLQHSKSAAFSDDQNAQFSIARIKAMPIGPNHHPEDIYCIVTSNATGTTTTFARDINSIEERSNEIYKSRLEYATTRAAMDAALSVLTEARAATYQAFGPKDANNISGSTDSVEHLGQVRKDLSEQISLLRKCLEKTKISKDDEPQVVEDKIKSFRETIEKAGFKEEDLFRALDVKTIDGKTSLVKDRDKKEELLKKLFSGQSTAEQRKEARNYTSGQMAREVNSKVKESTHNNKFKLELDGKEKEDLFDKYAQSSGIKNRAASFLSKDTFLPNTQRGLNDLASVEMPHSPYGGISITRPRGYGGNTVAITFDIKDNDFSKDVAWIALSVSGKAYHARVTVCEEDKKIDVYRNGKLEKEFHKKGDIVIDTGVVFERTPDGLHKPIVISEIASKSDKARVEEAFGDLRIKAVSVVDGKRCSSALLYNGHSVATELQQKSSHIQDVGQDRLNQRRDKIESGDVVFNHDKKGNMILLQPKDTVVEIAGNQMVLGKDSKSSHLKIGNAVVKCDDENFEQELTDLLQTLDEGKKSKFLSDLKESFGDRVFTETKELFEQGRIDDIAALITGSITNLYSAKLREANKKFASVIQGDDFNLLIPVDPTLMRDVRVASTSSKAAFEHNIQFAAPEIKLVVERDQSTKEVTEIKRVTVFGSKGELTEEAKLGMQQLSLVDFNKLASGFLSEEEVRKLKGAQGLNDPEQRQNFCDKLKAHCERTRVYVGFQEVERDGTRDGEDHYRDVGKVQVNLFDKTRGVVAPNPETKALRSETINQVAVRQASEEFFKSNSIESLRSKDDGSGDKDKPKLVTSPTVRVGR